jgi:non-ribosomal peptide synthetase component F
VRPGPALFAARQLAWLDSDAGRAAVTALADSVRGAPELLDLPTDLPRPPVRGSGGGRVERTLPDAVPDGLRRTAAAHRVTPHMVGLAAFAALLHRWSGLDDLLVGSAFAGRTDPESEAAIGCFVNLLPVRLRPDARQPFSVLLRQTRRAALLAASAQDVPLDSLVGRLRPRRTAAHTPLVQVSFGVVKPVAPVRRGEVVFEAVELGSDDARLDLTLWLEDRPDRMVARWTYRADLFRARTISDLHDRYAALLSAALSRPESAVAALLEA